VEYERIVDFLSPHECDELTDAIESSHRARTAQSGGVIHPLLITIDARLCQRLGFEPGVEGVLYGRLLDTGEMPQPADPLAPLSVFIDLNDVETGGEMKLGSSGCVLRPKPGTAVIARRLPGPWDPRFAPRDAPVRKGFKAMLIRHFPEAPRIPVLETPTLPLQRAKIPEPLFTRLRTYHAEHAAQATEERVPGFIEAASGVASELIGLPADLQHEVHSTLQPMVEAWARHSLAPTFVYGIRRYLRGATLKMHRDRTRTHVYGVSMNVDQQVDGAWPLTIEEQGRLNDVVLQPGEMVFYESLRLLHGRPQPLRGNFYAGVFAHFRPRSDPASSIEQFAITGCFPCARSR
jgi:prolyl 4-hydroxylase